MSKSADDSTLSSNRWTSLQLQPVPRVGVSKKKFIQSQRFSFLWSYKLPALPCVCVERLNLTGVSLTSDARVSFVFSCWFFLRSEGCLQTSG